MKPLNLNDCKVNRNIFSTQRNPRNSFLTMNLDRRDSEVTIRSQPVTAELARRIAEKIDAFHTASSTAGESDQPLVVVARTGESSAPALNSREGADLLLELAVMLGEE